jgi:hypothetical protein
MIQPNSSIIGKDGVITIILGGTEFPIPKFTFGTDKAIVPYILKITEKSQDTKEKNALSVLSSVLDDVGTVLFIALKVGHPELVKADLDNMPITSEEANKAYLAIMGQSSFLSASKETKPQAQKTKKA